MYVDLDLRRSVRAVIHHAVDELPARDVVVAREAFTRMWVWMPKVVDFMSPDLVERFFDLTRLVETLPRERSKVASEEECQFWLREITAVNRIALPDEGCRLCACRLLRDIFAFRSKDLNHLSVDFYRTLMAFVRPMREMVTRYHITC